MSGHGERGIQGLLSLIIPLGVECDDMYLCMYKKLVSILYNIFSLNVIE